jgi:hypothetical protein
MVTAGRMPGGKLAAPRGAADLSTADADSSYGFRNFLVK